MQDFVPLGEPHRTRGVGESVLRGNLVGSRCFEYLLLNSAPSSCCDFGVTGYRNELFVFNTEVVLLNSRGDFHSGKSSSAAPQSHGSRAMSLPGHSHVNLPSLIPGRLVGLLRPNRIIFNGAVAVDRDVCVLGELEVDLFLASGSSYTVFSELAFVITA